MKLNLTLLVGSVVNAADKCYWATGGSGQHLECLSDHFIKE